MKNFTNQARTFRLSWGAATIIIFLTRAESGKIILFFESYIFGVRSRLESYLLHGGVIVKDPHVFVCLRN